MMMQRREPGAKGVRLSPAQVTVTVGVYIFDLLYANGEVLVQLPLCERQDRLKQVASVCAKQY